MFDSRATSFADDVLGATGADGVDVVLNSLAGDSIAASLSCLKPAGRFVEIGRRGIWSPAQVAALRPQATYTVVDLAETLIREPGLVGATLRDVLARVEAGVLEPLPVTIERLETELATLTEAMHAPGFFQREATAIVAHNTKLADTQAELDKTYARWMELDAG